MWVFTREGFFSVVWDNTCRADELVARSQAREDIIRLVKRLSGYCDEERITVNFGASYRYSVKIAKQAWSAYLADCALQIDYLSVKEAIVPARDELRQEAYFQIWEALYRWRSRKDARQKEKRRRESTGTDALRLPVRWKP